MAEVVLGSPGITTRELDLSAPGVVRPQGIPAGVIGTSQKGPAFVPVNFATVNDFFNRFGATEGKHFGAMAVNEWMRNSRSGVFIRTLGVGDAKKANSYNVTTNAGFLVGSSMRDATNLAAAAQETDGSAHGLLANPYAGANVPEKFTVTKNAGTVQVVALAEKTDIAVTYTSLAAMDGEYFIIETIAANGDKTKRLFWLSAQATDRANTPGARTISGQKIVDGGIETDLSSTGVSSANIHFVDLTDIDGADTSASSAANVADAIKYWVNKARVAGGESYSNIPNAELDAVASSGTPVTIANGLQTDANDVAATLAYNKAGGTSTQLVPSNSTGNGQVGTDKVDHVVHQTTIEFHQSLIPPAGTTLLVNDGESSAESFTLTLVANADWNANYEIDIGTHNTPEKLAGFLYTYLIGGANADVAANVTALTVGGGSKAEAAIAAAVGNANMDGASGTPALLASQHMTVEGVVATASAGPKLIIRQSDGSPGSAAAGTATPVVTVTEDAADAPMGRIHFLGCSMTTSDNTQDYLDSTSAVDILRGVIMFPSGVIPGLDMGTSNHGPSQTSYIASGDMPSTAYGEYGSGKDQGDRIGDMDSTGMFKLVLNGFTNTSNYNAHITGSMDPTSPIYFPSVLNTDPTKIQERGHYLYAHYDVPAGLASHSGTANNVYLTPGAHDHNSGDWATASSTYKPTFENWRQKFSHANTPWIMSQTLGNAPKKLFKFHMLDAGSIGHGQIKVSIANIQKSTDPKSAYGKFDVQIRKADDLDSAPIILQSFSGLNLNPASDRYIARVIGDQNTFYEFEKNAGKQKLVTEGLYPNQSQYVRVQVVDQIESGAMEATALPIGFAGKNHLVINGDTLADDSTSASITLKEPALLYRHDVSIGQGNTKVVDARLYWGLQIQNVTDVAERNRASGTTSLAHNLTKHFPSVGEYPAWVGDNRNAAQGSGSADLDADAYNNNYFSLEKVLVRCKGADPSKAVDPRFWHEAVYIRDGNTSFNNVAGSPYLSVENGPNSDKHKDAANGYRYLDVSKDFAQSASKRFYKFTVPMQGGFDGLDIFDKDKADMSNLAAFREMSSNTSSVLGGPDGPTTAAFRKAIDILAEKSDVDIQLLAIPGMRDAGITDYAIDKTEERFDALYIMDMPAYDHDLNLVTTTAQETSVTNTAQTLVDRNLDTSFAATYFPDLVVQDGSTNVVAPPSVAVLGAMSLNDSVAHPWFAPAGFARGALASTIEASVYLNRPNMDVLYNADINPITSFPNSGESVVIFGQKTMLQAQSALDRVNVRRLLIDVRRKVRTVANTILFEPNRESTLARFSALVNPILGRIQQQQGLDRYKVVIDTTTTTQQDVENNTIRGKIFLQPTRSVEFISLDFVVTNAGAEI